MFSIQKFFGKDPKFFDLLTKSAEENLVGAQCIMQILQGQDFANNFQRLRDARRISKELYEETQELIIKTFVTSMDKEDIDALSTGLYKVLKPIEKFIERYEITKRWIEELRFIEQSKALCLSAEKALEIVKLVSGSRNLEIARKLNSSLQQTEINADELEVQLIKALYEDQTIDARQILATKDLYDLLEKGIDRCRDVGNIVMHIVLKNS